MDVGSWALRLIFRRASFSQWQPGLCQYGRPRNSQAQIWGPPRDCPPPPPTTSGLFTNKSQAESQIRFESSVPRPPNSCCISPEAHLNLVVSGLGVWGRVPGSLRQATEPQPQFSRLWKGEIAPTAKGGSDEVVRAERLTRWWPPRHQL